MTEKGLTLDFEAPDSDFSGFLNLFPHRVQDLLLVCSLYESYILEEEGLVSDLIFSEYQALSLSHAPRVWRASSADEALRLIQERHFDLVITMTRLGAWDVRQFAEAIKNIKPGLRVIVLADEPRDVARYADLRDRGAIDQIFLWHGDAKIFLAAIKSVEDRINVEHDTRVGNVRVIILIENSVRFYSAYLPVLYVELMKQTQALMAEGLNPVQKLMRMRARPKILLAETFEQAWGYYEKYRDNVLGVISDIGFLREGRMDDRAGLEFARRVKSDSPHTPVLLQSSNAEYGRVAAELGACFLHKRSPTLIQELRNFTLNNFGFGDFVFRLPDGSEIGRASNLRELILMLNQVPEESLLYHAGSNHFSNWLMARTEFELAGRLRPRKVTDFKTPRDVRTYLIEALTDFTEQTRAGVIADFSSQVSAHPPPFMRLGRGSIGGKGRGLAFINSLLKRYDLRHRFDDVHLAVPNCAAVGTDVFDAFLDESGLRRLVAQDLDDHRLAEALLAAPLPAAFRNDLAAYLEFVRCPLAVRSSGLLEDSLGQPFAGIYKTYMLPNNHLNLDVRLQQLCDTIRLVYASTFTRSAKRYMEATGYHVEEEKMGVILQEIVGAQYGDHFYPTFSGVARSYNFYPLGKLKPEEGICCVALGLGKMVVEGGEMLMFSPAHPEILPQFTDRKAMLANSQRSFYALFMGRSTAAHVIETDANLRTYDLEVAERDGTLAPLGSVYCPENDLLYDGINRPGARVITFAHILKSRVFPLADIIKVLLEIGRHGMACPIEIEFAVNLNARPKEFAVLQIRPTVSDEAEEAVALEEDDPSRFLCYSPQTMGNGYIRGLRDILFVKPDRFDSVQTRKIAAEIASLNEKLKQAGRASLLIGPGRWGSADPWLGIPVTWEQISTAQAIVETTLDDFVITPSQGTHFFQNLTSFRIGYLTVNPTAGGGFVDWDWLNHVAADPRVGRIADETPFVRHVQLAEPVEVKLDGRSRRGVISKPRADGTSAAAR
jgi:CheY-like chemotaxis protein